jgi:DNA ligase-1
LSTQLSTCLPTFTTLYLAIRDTSRSDEKVRLIAQYLTAAPHTEFGWAVYLLQGGSYRGGVKTRELRQWAAEVAQIPDWLFEESYAVTGDLAETVSLLVAPHVGAHLVQETPEHSLAYWIDRIEAINTAAVAERKELVLALWATMTQAEVLVFTKLLTGGLRIGVAKGLVAKALASVVGVSQSEVWQRLAGEWRPQELTREALSKPLNIQESTAPYPFFLAYPLEPDTLKELSSLDQPRAWQSEWQCEWKWDGIRAQIVKRAGQVAIWSRGDELVSAGFPELCAEFSALPDGTVLDGEIVAWSTAHHPASFAELQKRINRKKISPALQRAVPVRFIGYDILEHSGEDIRARPLRERRQILAALDVESLHSLKSAAISPTLTCASLEEARLLKQQARAQHAEGVMLKRLDAPYGVGRTARGAWWKWKIEPLSVDAVLLYAQKGHGRRADLFTDYTFGVWDGDTLVPFAKAYSGLRDVEIAQVDSFIKRNTKERFGPVRTVTPELVFEIAFEALWPSKRHRSGIAVRFPRIVRWRRDKKPHEADTLENLRNLAGLEPSE